jgi:hypothetical protein
MNLTIKIETEYSKIVFKTKPGKQCTPAEALDFFIQCMLITGTDITEIDQAIADFKKIATSDEKNI